MQKKISVVDNTGIIEKIYNDMFEKTNSSEIENIKKTNINDLFIKNIKEKKIFRNIRNNFFYNDKTGELNNCQFKYFLPNELVDFSMFDLKKNNNYLYIFMFKNPNSNKNYEHREVLEFSPLIENDMLKENSKNKLLKNINVPTFKKVITENTFIKLNLNSPAINMYKITSNKSLKSDLIPEKQYIKGLGFKNEIFKTTERIIIIAY